MAFYTFEDAVTDTRDFLGGDAGTQNLTNAKRAVVAAHSLLPNEHKWQYFKRFYKFTTQAPYSTGTIEYDASTGQVELSGGTWPSWANFGAIKIDREMYDVASVVDSTHVLLEVGQRPGESIAAGAGYSLYQHTYPLPEMAISIFNLRMLDWYAIDAVTPDGWLDFVKRYYYEARPVAYCVVGSRELMGRLAVRLAPVPDQAYLMEFLYKSRPMPLTLYRESTGSITANGTTTITGTGTAFTAAHVGQIIRIGTSAANAPTSFYGMYPFAEERIVTAVASATSLTVNTAAAATTGSVKYTISSPIDMETGAMQVAFQRLCEKEAAIFTRMETKVDYVGLYQQALLLAKEADSRLSQTRIAGESTARGGTSQFVYTDIP